MSFQDIGVCEYLIFPKVITLIWHFLCKSGNSEEKLMMGLLYSQYSLEMITSLALVLILLALSLIKFQTV
jgi:hypothetical protein